MRLRSGNLLWSFSLISLVLFAKIISLLLAPDLETQKPRAPTRLQVGSGTVPFYFERNQGQSPPQVKFLARAAEAQIFLTSREVIFDLPATGPKESVSFSMRFKDANQAPYVTADEPLSGRTNYLVGNDPSHWNTKISHYGRVRYRELYPGIDLVFYENQGQLEYDFLVAPGADPNQIQLEFLGIDEALLGRDGRLVLQAGDHTIIQHIPAVYQEIQGRRQTVEVRHQVDAAGRVRFALADYDRSHTLILDPVLEFARFFGGSGEEEILSVATDEDGNIYMTGSSSSPDLPVTPKGLPYPSGVFETEGNRLAFVAKLDPTGTQLLYLTYLGGSKTSTGHNIKVDSAGSAYVGGRTEADDFPLRNPIQSLYGGGSDDGFLSKLHPDGSSLIYSTYLGGSEYDQVRALALDSAGNVYLTGRTESRNFPTVNPILSDFSGRQDAFLAKVSQDGSRLVYSTYIGGSENDVGHAITVDQGGNAYITGLSNSPDFPTANAFQARFRGGEGDDTIVVKVNPSGTGFVYSTFLGGSKDDESRAIAVDASGNVTITGYTQSTDFPTSNALQADFGGGSHDIFLTSLNAQGSGLRYSTYLGGSGSDYGRGLALDAAGNIYLTGYTDSGDFPTHQPLQGRYAGGTADSIVVKLNPMASQLLYSSFLGGSGYERGRAITVDVSGNILVSGRTESRDFSVTHPPSPTFGGGPDDAFLVKVAPE